MIHRSGLDRRHMPRGGRRAFDRSGRHPSILVADSYVGARQACARYLEQFHFDVSEAADAEQALERILKAPPHVILTEWNLPSVPVGRLQQWMTQRRPDSDIPVIVLGTAVEADASLPRVAGLLRKPFSLSEMLDEVRRVLRANRS
jgi:two-component system nitrogen regulation response regulator GlnG